MLLHTGIVIISFFDRLKKWEGRLPLAPRFLQAWGKKDL
jgi:hypothetical protein